MAGIALRVQGVQAGVQHPLHSNGLYKTGTYHRCAGVQGFSSRRRARHAHTPMHARTPNPRVYARIPLHPCTQCVNGCCVKAKRVQGVLHTCLHTLHNLINGGLSMALKDEMPQVAAWVADLRAVFCETPADLASFNRQIKAGLEGQPTFWARENGREVGTKDHRQGVTPVLPLKIDLAAGKRERRGA